MLGFDVKDFLFITTVDGARHAINRSNIVEFEEKGDYIHIRLVGTKEWSPYKIT